jgi:hypothetical protein
MKTQNNQPDPPYNKEQGSEAKNTDTNTNKNERNKGNDTTTKPVESDKKTATPVKTEKVTNEDNKVTNDDNKVNNNEEDTDTKLKPGKTADPDISTEEKKEIKTKINTTPGNNDKL